MSGRLIAVLFALAACEGGKGGPLDGANPTTDAPGSGTVCGGFAGTPCPTGEFCKFATNNCGGTDETGTCQTRPATCNDRFDPVCGCDGNVYSNPCEAAAAGIDLNAFGSCDVEPGQFACGFRVCNLAADFCLHQVSDIGGVPDDFACEPLPIGCGNVADCDCLAGEPCGAFCSGTQATGLRLDCPGG